MSRALFSRAAVAVAIVAGTLWGTVGGSSATTTSDFRGIENFVISRDGQQIAFLTGDGPNGPGLYVSERDGTDVRFLRSRSGPPSLTFTPDGTRIIYDDFSGGNGRLACINVSDGTSCASPVTDIAGRIERQAAYSFDGAKLVYVAQSQTQSWDRSVRVVDLASGTETVVGIGGEHPTFAHDGSVLVIEFGNSHQELFRLPGHHQVTHLGRQFIFSVAVSQSPENLGEIVVATPRSITTVGPDGAGAVDVVSLPENVQGRAARWTPGGRVGYLTFLFPQSTPPGPTSSTTMPGQQTTTTTMPTGQTTTTMPSGQTTTTTMPTGQTTTTTVPPGPTSSTTMPSGQTTTTTVSPGPTSSTTMPSGQTTTTTAPTGQTTTSNPNQGGGGSKLVIPTDPVVETAAEDGVVSSGDEATPLVPVAAAVQTPTGGEVTIDTSAETDGAPSGYEFIGQQVSIHAPDASIEDPLQLTFLIDRSALQSAGLDATSLVIFRNGTAIAPCADPDVVRADPQPCVASRRTLAEGDAEIVVYTAAASEWNFGRPAATPVARASTTALSCTPSETLVDEAVSCTVTVSDAGGGTASAPAGSVRVASTVSNVAFPSGDTCQLAGSGSSTTCTVTVRATGVASDPQTIPLTAAYAPEGGTHEPSQANAGLTVRTRPTSVTITCDGGVSKRPARTAICTASVTDNSPGLQSSPNGTVRFTSSEKKTSFSASACTLASTGANKSACSVTVDPNRAVAGARDTITGAYTPASGPQVHRSSSGSGKLSRV